MDTRRGWLIDSAQIHGAPFAKSKPQAVRTDPSRASYALLWPRILLNAYPRGP